MGCAKTTNLLWNKKKGEGTRVKKNNSEQGKKRDEESWEKLKMKSDEMREGRRRNKKDASAWWVMRPR